MPDPEQRLTRLEELASFRKNSSGNNAALTAQQTQLDKVERDLADALAVIRLLRELASEQPENTLPPHFMPERY